MTFLIKTADAISTLTKWSGKLASALLLLLIAMVFYNVGGRYIFGDSPVWMQEMEWHVLAPIALLGISVLMLENGHVRVDMLYERLPRKYQLLLDLFSMIVGAIVALLFVKYSINFVDSSWSIGEGSADPGGLPMRYVLKAILPASFLLLALQCFANAIRHFVVLKNRDY